MGYISIGRGKLSNREKNFRSLCNFYAYVVTGDNKQDISQFTEAKKGRGKSYANLSIAYHCALELAEILGGHWSDYYSLEELTAIIDEEAANNLMAVTRKYVIKNFDDIAIGWGARNWNDEKNKEKNDIFQINRVDNTIQLLSAPDANLIDKVPREQISHLAVMDAPFFRFGFTTMKVYQPQKIYISGKQVTPFLGVGNSRFVLYYVPRPPTSLTDEYDRLREEITRRVISEKREKLKSASEPTVGRRDKVDHDFLNEYGQRIADIRMNQPDIPLTSLAKSFGITSGRMAKYCKKLGVEY